MQGVSINLPDNILNHPEFLTEERGRKTFPLRKTSFKTDICGATTSEKKRELCNFVADGRI